MTGKSTVNTCYAIHFREFGIAGFSVTLTKVHKMASSIQLRRDSAYTKLREFHFLLYPTTFLKSICNSMAYHTGDRIWFAIRKDIDKLDI